jgi:hypothetical protein
VHASAWPLYPISSFRADHQHSHQRRYLFDVCLLASAVQSAIKSATVRCVGDRPQAGGWPPKRRLDRAAHEACIPKSVTMGQMIAVVVKYVDEHPEDMHSEFLFLAHEALLTAWPCKP